MLKKNYNLRVDIIGCIRKNYNLNFIINFISEASHALSFHSRMPLLSSKLKKCHMAQVICMWMFLCQDGSFPFFFFFFLKKLCNHRICPKLIVLYQQFGLQSPKLQQAQNEKSLTSFLFSSSHNFLLNM